MVGTKSKHKRRPTSIHTTGFKAIDFSFHQGSFHPPAGRERNDRKPIQQLQEKKKNLTNKWKIAAQHASWVFLPLLNYCSIYSSARFSSSLYVHHFRKEFEWSGNAK